MRRVGAHGETVASVARQLAVGWHTVMRAVRDYGQPLVDDPARLDGSPVSAWMWAGTAALAVRGPVIANTGSRLSE